MDPRVKPTRDARERASAEPMRTGTALVSVSDIRIIAGRAGAKHVCLWPGAKPRSRAGRSPFQSERHTGSMEMMSLRRTCIGFLVLGILPFDLLVTQPAEAQDYPNQTVKIIVPFTAGGGVDV